MKKVKSSSIENYLKIYLSNMISKPSSYYLDLISNNSKETFKNIYLHMGLIEKIKHLYLFLTFNGFLNGNFFHNEQEKLYGI